MWFHLFQIHFKLLHWQFSLSDEVRRLEEEIECVNAEVARTKAGYERVEECNAKTMAEVATLAGDLVEATMTIQGNELRNVDLLSLISVLRHQLDVTATDKDCLHASTQTDPLPSVVTSLSRPRSSVPSSRWWCPGHATDGPREGTDLSTPNDGGKSAFRRQLKYKHKLGAVI